MKDLPDYYERVKRLKERQFQVAAAFAAAANDSDSKRGRPLLPRETQIALLAADGNSAKDIACMLDITSHTAKSREKQARKAARQCCLKGCAR